MVASVTLKNLASNYISDVAYLLSINPNQDAVGATPTSSTYNQVNTNPNSPGETAVIAASPSSGVDFARYANQTEINEANSLLDGTIGGRPRSRRPTSSKPTRRSTISLTLPTPEEARPTSRSISPTRSACWLRVRALR